MPLLGWPSSQISCRRGISMLLLCCNLLSLAEGGSTTVVAGGFHLPHCCPCRSCESRACRRQLDRSNRIEGTPRRSESETIEEVHANSACLAGFSGIARFPQAENLPTSAASSTAALHHPAGCAILFSALRCSMALGGDFASFSLPINLRGLAFSLVYGQRLRSTFFISASSTPRAPIRNSTRRTRA